MVLRNNNTNSYMDYEVGAPSVGGVSSRSRNGVSSSERGPWSMAKRLRHATHEYIPAPTYIPQPCVIGGAMYSAAVAAAAATAAAAAAAAAPWNMEYSRAFLRRRLPKKMAMNTHGKPGTTFPLVPPPTI